MNKKSTDSKKQDVEERFNQAMDSLDFFEKIIGDKASK